MTQYLNSFPIVKWVSRTLQIDWRCGWNR